MDLDTTKASQTRCFISYFDVSTNFPWRDPRPEQIERRRALLDDKLIFDLLLSSGGVKRPDVLYPPTDVPSLRQLLDAIESSSYDALKKECLVYYLLKWHQDGREERFQIEHCIPPHFAALSDAYWLLDTGTNVPRAISILSDARLNKDYPSKILKAISLLPNHSTLLVKYVRTAKPTLTEVNDLETYVTALAESSLSEAWGFQRTFGEANTNRSRLFKKLLEWCVTPKPKPTPLKQLLGIPLSPFEQDLLYSYASQPPLSLSSASMAVLQDLYCVRLVQAGQYTEAIKADHQFTALTSSRLKGLTLERTKMAQELYTSLSGVERLLLDEELRRTEKPSVPSAKTVVANGDVSMSSSWEEVRVPRSPSPGKLALLSPMNRETQSQPKSLTERSQAPRFGGPLPKKSLAVVEPPVIPLSSISPKPAPRKSFPLPSLPVVNNKAPLRPRHSGGPVHANANNINNKGPSPSVAPAPAKHEPAAVNGASTSFSSANRSKNAFYQPPSKQNGRFADEHERPVTTRETPEEAMPDREDVDADMGDADHMEDRHWSIPRDEAGPPSELQFSLFGKNSGTSAPKDKTSLYASEPWYIKSPAANHKKVPPGAFGSDEDEPMSDEHEEWEKPNVHNTRSRTTRTHRQASTSAGKPVPVEKRTTRARQHTMKEEPEKLKHSLPGSLMMDEDEEEEDHVAPLRHPSPPRRGQRKARSSLSSELGDEPEGSQTRRRSSRLSSSAHQMQVTSPETSPKKPSTSARAKKSTKSSSSTTAKRKR